MLVSGLFWAVVLSSKNHSRAGSLFSWKYPGRRVHSPCPEADLPMIPKMTSHREDGLTLLRQVGSTPQGYPAILAPPRYRVLPSALREDLQMVTMMTGHCNNRLTLLRQADSIGRQSQQGPRCFSASRLTGGPPVLYLSIEGVLRKLSPQFSSLIVGLVTCCPAFHVPKCPGPQREGRVSLLNYP